MLSIKKQILFAAFLIGKVSWGVSGLQARKIIAGHKNQEGKMIIRFESDSSSKPLIFFGDSHGLSQLHIKDQSAKWLGRNLKTYQISFEDNRLKEKSGRFGPREGKYELTCDGHRQSFLELSPLEKNKIETKLRFEKIPLNQLPEVRSPMQLFKVENSETYIYIDKLKYYHDKVKIFIGPKGRLKEAAVTRQVRLRDGGTAYLVLADGSKVYYSRSRSDLHPQWNGKNLVSLDLRKFNIQSLGIGVSDEIVLSTPCDKFFP